MKKKINFSKGLEYTWLLVIIVSLAAAVYTTLLKIEKSFVLYIVVCLSSLMYFSRRYLRKTREKINK